MVLCPGGLLVGVIALTALSSGCSNTGKEPRQIPARTEVARQLKEPIALSGTAPLPPPYAAQADWVLAAQGDPMNLAVLARRLGAAELAARVSDGGRVGAVALEAFAHAPDAWAERARVCRLLSRLADPDRRRALWVLQDVLQHPPRGEVLDGSADVTCLAELSRLDRRSSSPQELDLLSVVEQRLRPLR